MTSRFATRTSWLATALLLASCWRDATGPHEARLVPLAVRPQFANPLAPLVVTFDRVHIVLLRSGTNTAAVDTVVSFPANQDTLAVVLTVPVEGTSQQFSMTMQLIDSNTNTVVFTSGPTAVTVTAGASSPPVAPTLVYVGTGANAAGVRFVSPPAEAFFQDTVSFTAEAFDSGGVAIPSTPILWRVTDTTRALVPDRSVGRVVARQTRGVDTVVATLLTPRSARTPLVIQPRAAALRIQGGNNQSGTVGSQLAQPIAARVLAADSLGVQGVVVTFSVTSGGGSLSQSADTTDVNGDASVLWTLGSTVGSQSVTATVPGLTGGSVGFAAVAAVGPARKVAFQQQPTSGNAFQAISPAVKVVAQDSFGNTVTAFTGNVTVALGANPSGATLSGTLTVAAVSGVATFSTLSLDKLGTGYTLVATATGLTSATSSPFDITGGVPTSLAFSVQPTSVAAGSAITPAVKVEIRDGSNNLVTGATNAVTIAIGTNAGGGTLTGTLTASAVGGVATFPDLSLDKAGSGYTLTASASGLTGATSSAFNVTAATAAQISLVSGNLQIATVGTGLTDSVVVKVTDSFGNPVGSRTITWSVVTGSGAVTSASTTTDAAGLAYVRWTLGSGFGEQQVRATSSGLTGSPVSFDALATPIGMTKRWRGGGGIAGLDWSNASNWVPSGVPTSTDNVFIPIPFTAFTNNGAGLTASVSVGDVYAESSVTVNMGSFNLTAFGSVGVPLTSGGIAGTGTLILSGSGKTAAGRLPAVQVTGTYTFAGTSSVNGQLQIASGSLRLGGSTVSVTDSLVVTGTGLLLMHNAADVLTVQRNARFNGGNMQDTALTAGLLQIGGNFLSQFGNGFNATGNHTTSFNGTAAQSISLAGAGSGASSGHFGALQIANAAGVTLAGATNVNGALALSSGALLGGSTSLVVAGAVTSQATSILNPTRLDLGGALSVGGSYGVRHTTFTGAGQTMPGGVSYDTVEVQGSVSLGGSATLTGKLAITGSGALSVNGQALTIADSLALYSTGRLLMQSALDSVVVNGPAYFNGGGVQDTALTAGVLRLRRNLQSTFGNGFNAAASHRTVFDGSSSQTISLSGAGQSAGTGHFRNLEIVNPAGVSLAADGAATGSVVIRTGAGNVTGSGRLMSIGGDLLDTTGGRWQVARTQLVNARARRLPATLTTDLEFAGSDTLTANLAVTGKVTVSGVLKVSGRALTMTDSLVTSGAGRMLMQNALDSVVVGTHARFNGGGLQDTALTAGVLRVRGNFTSTFGNGFNAAATHRTVLDGTSAQSVSLSGAGTTTGTGHFRDLVIANTAGVTFPVAGAVVGDFSLQSGTSLSGAGPLTVTGNVTTASPSTLSVQTLAVGGVLSVTGTFAVRHTTFIGTNQTVPAALAYDTIEIQGSAALGGNVGATGKLLISGTGALRINGHRISVSDSLSTTSNGRLLMQNAGDTVQVLGAARFNGGGLQDTALTAGVLQVSRDFTSTFGNGFNASGTHRTELLGTGLAQTVSIAGGGSSVGSGHFNRLYISNVQGVVLALDFANNDSAIVAFGNVTGVGRTITLGGSLVDTSGTHWLPTNTVFVNNLARSLPATITSNVTFAGRDTLTGNLIVNGMVNVSGALKLNGHALTVSDSLFTTSNGVLLMQNAADSVVVNRQAKFNGGSFNDTALTAGVLRVRGNFTSTFGNGFNATAAHRTVLDGTASQSVALSGANTTVGSGHFGALEIRNAAGVVFTADAAARGQVVVFNAAGPVTGSATTRLVSMARNFQDTLAHWAVGNVRLDSSRSRLLPASIASNVEFTGRDTLTGNLSIAGKLAISGALKVNGRALTVSDSLVTSGNGLLLEQNALDSIVVIGHARFNGGSTNDTALTAGVLRVRGNFSSTFGNGFNATPAHRTVLDGSSSQTVSLAGAGTAAGSGHFGTLEIRNASGVVFGSDGAARGNVVIFNAAGSVTGVGRLVMLANSLHDTIGGRWQVGSTRLDSVRTTRILPASVATNLEFAGSDQLNGSLSVTGKVTVSGYLNVNGKALVMSDSLVTAGNGILAMHSTSDSVQVGGHARFNGGIFNDTALTAGVIRFRGNVTSTFGNGFNASGTHRSVFDGGSGIIQRITLASPGAGTGSGHFNRLELDRPGADSVYLGSDVYTRDSVVLRRLSILTSNNGGATGSDQALILPASTSGVFRVHTQARVPSGLRRVEAGVFVIDSSFIAPSNIVAPDTAVYLLAGQLIPTGSNISWQSIRVMDSLAVFTGTLSIARDLVISSGTANGVFEVNGSSTFTVGGKLRTQNSGALRMTIAGASIVVSDSAIFGGGSETGRLTNSVLSLRGNFVQTGLGTSFAPSGNHTTLFNGPAPAVQTISFANSSSSFFDSVVVDRGVGASSAVQLRTDALVNRGLVMQNSSDLTSLTTQRITLGRVLRMLSGTTHPTFHPFVASMANAPVIDSIFSVVFFPDTTVYTAAMTLPTGSTVAYRSVRFSPASPGTLSFSSSNPNDTLANDLVITIGTFSPSSSIIIHGKLKTQGTGTLTMNASLVTVTVRDSAVFGGGSSAPSVGTLALGGNFVQTGGNTFVATSGHTTLFNGSTTQTVRFASPGSSTFGALSIGRASGGLSQPAGITLQSPIFVAGFLQDTSNSAVDSILGAGNTVTANGISTGSKFVMNNAPLATNSSSLFSSGLTFRNMSTTITQWAMNLPPSSSVSLSGLSFETGPTTGLYFAALLSSTGSGSLTVTSGSPPAATISGRYTRTNANGSITVTWNGTPNP